MTEFTLDESRLADVLTRYEIETDHGALLALDTVILGDGDSDPILSGPCDIAVDLLADEEDELDGYRIILHPDADDTAPWLASNIQGAASIGMTAVTLRRSLGNSCGSLTACSRGTRDAGRLASPPYGARASGLRGMLGHQHAAVPSRTATRNRRGDLMLFDEQHCVLLDKDNNEVAHGVFDDEIDARARSIGGYLVQMNSDPPHIFADYRPSVQLGEVTDTTGRVRLMIDFPSLGALREFVADLRSSCYFEVGTDAVKLDNPRNGDPVTAAVADRTYFLRNPAELFGTVTLEELISDGRDITGSIGARVPDGKGDEPLPGGLELTRAQLRDWAGLDRDLTDSELGRLAKCIPRSSITDAINTIVTEALRLTDGADESPDDMDEETSN